ncbi:hypothetical protein [Fibrobacter sp. UWS1]|nr:hypothetical protein [Fibrobacter sp. UWS1]
MELFDNVVKTVKDDLLDKIRRGSRVSVAAACFANFHRQCD